MRVSGGTLRCSVLWPLLCLIACVGCTTRTLSGAPDDRRKPRSDAKPAPPGDGPDVGGSADGVRAGEQGSVVMVPTRDGTKLWTRIARPPGATGKVPVVVTRSPYEALLTGDDYFVRDAKFFNERGYAVVFQATRGIHGSEGQFFPYRDDVEDGAALVDWIAAQPWADADRIGTYGCSYGGFTALASAIGNRKVKAVYADGPVASEASILEGGVRALDTLSWLYYVEHGDFAPEDLMRKATNERATGDLDQLVLGHRHPFWQEMQKDLQPAAPFWKSAGIDDRWQDLCAPTLVTAVGESTATAVWEGMQRSGCPAAKKDYHFIYLPGEHCTPINNFYDEDHSPEAETIEAFFAKHLKGEAGHDIPTAQYRADAKGALAAADAFPPRGREVTLYLRNTAADGGTLAASDGPAGAAARLADDPDASDPCDTPPSLVYESEPFPAEALVVGRPALSLSIRSDAPDTDVFADVVIGEGKGALMTGAARARYRFGYDAPRDLAPGRPETVRLVSTPLAAVKIPAGERLYVYLSLTRCSTLENPHSGLAEDGSRARAATVDVLSGPASSSTLTFTVEP